MFIWNVCYIKTLRLLFPSCRLTCLGGISCLFSSPNTVESGWFVVSWFVFCWFDKYSDLKDLIQNIQDTIPIIRNKTKKAWITIFLMMWIRSQDLLNPWDISMWSTLLKKSIYFAGSTLWTMDKSFSEFEQLFNGSFLFNSRNL